MERRRWLVPALLILGWLALGSFAGPYQGRLGELTQSDEAFLPASAESTQVGRLQRRFDDTGLISTVVVYERPGGITEADRAAVSADVQAISRLPGVSGPIGPAVSSTDGQALQLFVPLPGEGLTPTVTEVREIVGQHPGLAAHVTGVGGLFADLDRSYGNIDTPLLLASGILVALILLLVYRSPTLPIVVLLCVGFALGLAALAVYQLTSADVIGLNGQSQGVLSILVVGATTDYALLLIGRYREELRRQQNRYDALATAWRTVFWPILASGGTVILGLLCLLLSDLNSNRSMGPVAALGIGASLLAGLTLLPAVLALLGRAAFWPVRPKYGSVDRRERGLWVRIPELVGRRPRAIWLVTVLFLLAAAAFVPQFKASGVSVAEGFLNRVDSVAGLEQLSRHYPGGTGTPAVIIANASAANAVAAAARSTPGVAAVAAVTDRPGDPSAPPRVVDGLVQLEATLDIDDPDGGQAGRVVRDLRRTVHAVPGADARVGGYTAVAVDTRDTARRDLIVIIPVVLAAILLVLVLVLRAVVAGLVLIATVALSFAATMGISALVFNHVFHFPGADPTIPLFGFVFLIAFGVDYNIFLMTRAREEAAVRGARDGTLTALRVTGGIITSAGVVLAATFAALAVVPQLFLAELAFIVACGLLLDTFIVRSLLAPAVAVDLGEAMWWPSRVGRDRVAQQSGAGVHAPGVVQPMP